VVNNVNDDKRGKTWSQRGARENMQQLAGASKRVSNGKRGKLVTSQKRGKTCENMFHIIDTEISSRKKDYVKMIR